MPLRSKKSIDIWTARRFSIQTQSEQIANAAKQIVQKVLSDLKPAIDQHVSDSHKEIFKAYLKRQDDYFKANDNLLIANKLNAENSGIISDLLAVMHNP